MLLLTQLSLTFKSQTINNRLGGYPAARLPCTLLPIVRDVKAQLGREILTARWPLIRIQSGLSGVQLSDYWFNATSHGMLTWVAFLASGICVGEIERGSSQNFLRLGGEQRRSAVIFLERNGAFSVLIRFD